jgi:CelD/BcsL family acetyltransferase involved in cellulose biosynthesis
MVHWAVFKLQNGLGEHAQEWDALNQRKFKNHPMLDSRFVNGLLWHFGGEGECLCVLEKAGRAEAMCLLRHDQFSRWTTFLPSQAQLGPALVDSPADLQQLMRDLPGLLARLDMLCSDSALGDLAAEPKRTTYTSDHALTMNITLKGGFQDYWRARPRKLVQNIGRYERRLATEGIQTDYHCHREPLAISEAFVRYANLESQGWKASGGTAIGIDNAQGRFYEELLSGFAATGNALVYELWFGGQLAASRLVITSNDMVVMVKTTYAEAFARFAPGRLLLRHAVEHLFTLCPGSLIELYTNASVDQLAWATGQREIRHISFYTDSFTAHLFGFLRNFRNRFLSPSVPR